MAGSRRAKSGGSERRSFKRKIGSDLEVRRVHAVHRPTKANAFEACFRVGKMNPYQGGHVSEECATASNPRKAIAKVLQRVGRQIGSRSGTFAGMKSKTKRSR